MHVLFIHQNFPAQFKHLAPWLAREFGWTVSFASHNDQAPAQPGVTKILCPLARSAAADRNPCARRFNHGVEHGLGVYDALKARPDIKSF